MEQSQHEYPKSSDTIKGIQQTLLLLKSKIEHMQKEEARNISNIDRVVSSSIPVLQNKFNLTQKSMEVEHKRSGLLSLNKNRFREITQNKFEHEKEVTRNREALIKAKFNQTQHIKEISKRNDEIIAFAKQKHQEENRKKSELVKVRRNQSKQKVEQFHLLKKYDLKKRKIHENEQLDKKLKAFKHSVNSLAEVQKDMNEKVRETKIMFKKVRYAVEKLTKMKEEKFKDLTTYLGIQKPDSIKYETLERILNEINLNSYRELEKSHSMHNIKKNTP